MLRDITIGKYYNKASVIHQMDCRTKLAGTLLYIIALFFVENPIVYIPCLVYLLILYRLAAIPWSYILKGLRGFALLLLFTFVFQSLITDGRALFSIGIFTVSQEGLLKAVRLVSRIVLMVLMASLLAYTTTPTQMAAGLEKSKKSVSVSAQTGRIHHLCSRALSARSVMRCGSSAASSSGSMMEPGL